MYQLKISPCLSQAGITLRCIRLQSDREDDRIEFHLRRSRGTFSQQHKIIFISSSDKKIQNPYIKHCAKWLSDFLQEAVRNQL